MLLRAKSQFTVYGWFSSAPTIHTLGLLKCSIDVSRYMSVREIDNYLPFISKWPHARLADLAPDRFFERDAIDPTKVQSVPFYGELMNRGHAHESWP